MDSEIEVCHFECPSSMSVGEVLGFFEELETNMISVKGDLVWDGKKEVFPFHEGMDYGEELSIVCQVGLFRGREHFRTEGNGIPCAILILFEEGARSNQGSVGEHLEGVLSVGEFENRL